MNLKRGVNPLLSGLHDESSNGNGSLMRIIPLLFIVKDLEIHKQFKIIREVSSITHGHVISIISCFIYLQIARYILNGDKKYETYTYASNMVQYFAQDSFEYVTTWFNESDDYPEMQPPSRIDLMLRPTLYKFNHVFCHNLPGIDFSQIESDGYVMHTLEASICCLLSTTSYEEAVLKAVNLGDDSDTTAAVTGALAGLYYGYESIPERWLSQLARRKDIEDLCLRFYENLK